MKLDDEVYDECIEKIRKTMNFYGYQNREMADDILSDVSMPISRPLQETIRTQQATIERLTEQLKDMVETYQYEASSENPTLLAAKALIAEIEAEK